MNVSIAINVIPGHFIVVVIPILILAPHMPHHTVPHLFPHQLTDHLNYQVSVSQVSQVLDSENVKEGHQLVDLHIFDKPDQLSTCDIRMGSVDCGKVNPGHLHCCC